MSFGAQNPVPVAVPGRAAGLGALEGASKPPSAVCLVPHSADHTTQTVVSRYNRAGDSSLAPGCSRRREVLRMSDPRADERASAIRGVPMLARLADDDLRALAARGRLKECPDGSVIFFEGSEGDALYVIMEGALRVFVTSDVGGEASLALLGRGEACGELSLLDGRPRSASAQAVGSTKLLVVGSNEFNGWLAERPLAARVLLEELSLRLRRADQIIADMAFLDVRRRLAKRLIELSSARPARTGSGAAAAPDDYLRVTQAELASMLGVSRESVNKELNAFARHGWIHLRRGAVQISDADALGAVVRDEH